MHLIVAVVGALHPISGIALQDVTPATILISSDALFSSREREFSYRLLSFYPPFEYPVRYPNAVYTLNVPMQLQLLNVC